MATDILLIREGNKLGAADPISAEAIAAMGHGEYVLATIKRARNPRHHRKLMALLQIVLDNQERYKTIDSILNAIKIGTGHCTWGTVWLSGVPIQVGIPKSISFANMPQDKFEKFYSAAVNFIVTDIIPGLEQGDLLDRVVEFMS